MRASLAHPSSTNPQKHAINRDMNTERLEWGGGPRGRDNKAARGTPPKLITTQSDTHESDYELSSLKKLGSNS